MIREKTGIFDYKIKNSNTKYAYKQKRIFNNILVIVIFL